MFIPVQPRLRLDLDARTEESEYDACTEESEYAFPLKYIHSNTVLWTKKR